jgi:IS30 family transposase
MLSKVSYEKAIVLQLRKPSASLKVSLRIIYRWLVWKHRNGEAHLVLTKINHHPVEDKCMDTHFELEELKEAVMQAQGALKEMLKWKNMSRYVVGL